MVFFTVIFVSVSVILILMAYYKILHFQKNDVLSDMQESRGLKCFSLVFCEYNWKVSNPKAFTRFLYAMSHKVHNYFREEIKEREFREQNDEESNFWGDICRNIGIYCVLLGSIGASVVVCVLLNNGVIFSREITSSPFINECVLSLIITVFAEII